MDLVLWFLLIQYLIAVSYWLLSTCGVQTRKIRINYRCNLSTSRYCLLSNLETAKSGFDQQYKHKHISTTAHLPLWKWPWLKRKHKAKCLCLLTFIFTQQSYLGLDVQIFTRHIYLIRVFVLGSLVKTRLS